MQQFIENNWLSLLSIIIGVLVAYIFFRLQRKDSSSASAERKKHATVELLDVVESYIINKQGLSEHVINNLIFASERDHVVALRPACTAISLLQDVALRLQRSRHLDIAQKSEYSVKIEDLIKVIRESREPVLFDQLAKEIRTKLSEVEELVPEEKRGEARKSLAVLATLSDSQRELATKKVKTFEIVDVMAPVMAGLTAVFASALVGSRLFEKLEIASPVISTFSLGKVLPFLAGFVLMAMLLQVILTVRRIQRRSKEGREQSSNES